jgi:hypothetical protein
MEDNDVGSLTGKRYFLLGSTPAVRVILRRRRERSIELRRDVGGQSVNDAADLIPETLTGHQDLLV